MRFLPVFLDASTGVVALIGATDAALCKLRLLRAAGAHVRWFPLSVDVAEEALVTSGRGRFELSLDDPLEADFSDIVAVISAAGPLRDAQVAEKARALRLPVNVVDRPDLSTFIMPAIVDRGDVVVAIGTSGDAPVLARRLRERIEALVPPRIGELSAFIGRWRKRLNGRLGSTASRRHFWERVIDGPIGEAVLAGRTAEADAQLASLPEPRRAADGHVTGQVTLVGAGPGDPDLLTLKALRALQDADVVFYDELVTPEILDRVRRDAARVFVGKRKGIAGMPQEEINRRLADAAREGQRVVRLKSGDPFVFGRGGEELEHLREAGIATFVVPGITAALGCAAESGLPLTYRGEATRLALITAQQAHETTDWSGAADAKTTAVIYMGLTSATAVRDGLVAAGRDPSTPTAVLARGTRPDAQAAVGRLDELPQLAACVGEGPALIVVGEVVRRSAPWRAAELTDLIATAQEAA